MKWYYVVVLICVSLMTNAVKHLFMRVPSWLSVLRIHCCHCCGSGHCCDVGLIPISGISACLGQKKKKKSSFHVHIYGEMFIQILCPFMILLFGFLLLSFKTLSLFWILGNNTCTYTSIQRSLCKGISCSTYKTLIRHKICQ